MTNITCRYAAISVQLIIRMTHHVSVAGAKPKSVSSRLPAERGMQTRPALEPRMQSLRTLKFEAEERDSGWRMTTVEAMNQ